MIESVYVVISCIVAWSTDDAVKQLNDTRLGVLNEQHLSRVSRSTAITRSRRLDDAE